MVKQEERGYRNYLLSEASRRKGFLIMQSRRLLSPTYHLFFLTSALPPHSLLPSTWPSPMHAQSVSSPAPINRLSRTRNRKKITDMIAINHHDERTAGWSAGPTASASFLSPASILAAVCAAKLSPAVVVVVAGIPSDSRNQTNVRMHPPAANSMPPMISINC